MTSSAILVAALCNQRVQACFHCPRVVHFDARGCRITNNNSRARLVSSKFLDLSRGSLCPTMTCAIIYGNILWKGIAESCGRCSGAGRRPYRWHSFVWAFRCSCGRSQQKQGSPEPVRQSWNCCIEEKGRLAALLRATSSYHCRLHVVCFTICCLWFDLRCDISVCPGLCYKPFLELLWFGLVLRCGRATIRYLPCSANTCSGLQ